MGADFENSLYAFGQSERVREFNVTDLPLSLGSAVVLVSTPVANLSLCG